MNTPQKVYLVEDVKYDIESIDNYDSSDSFQFAIASTIEKALDAMQANLDEELGKPGEEGSVDYDMTEIELGKYRGRVVKAFRVEASDGDKRIMRISEFDVL